MRDKSIDELLEVIEDAFDAAIAPKMIVRNTRNKMHLMFKADAAGYAVLNRSVLALSQRFNPELCDEADLDTVGKIVGTERIAGKVSSLQITAANSSLSGNATLAAGVYQYRSSSGEVFTFTVPTDRLFSPSESKVYYAVSADIGAYRVLSVLNASLTRADSASIPSDFIFSCSDNLRLLGRAEEDSLAFRKRLISAADRDDIVNEIELAIKDIPNIYECNCLFNHGIVDAVIDGITLKPRELLIVITGVPSQALADAVATRCHYLTHMVDAANVVYFESPRLVNGRYPVYFKYHDATDYTVSVAYAYDSTKVKQAQAEAGIGALLEGLMEQNTHTDSITEKDVYDALEGISLASVSILNVDLAVGGSSVPYVAVPRTRVPRLTAVTYNGTDTRS